MMQDAPFSVAYASYEALNARLARCSEDLGSFPSGPDGRTSDAVKALAQYRYTKANYDRALKDLRSFNATFQAKFKAELKAMRVEKRRQRP